MTAQVEMRGKVVISEITGYEGDIEKIKFRAVCKTDGYPKDGSDENNTYAKFSPQLDIDLTVTNPELAGKFKAGDTFYIDWVRAEK